MGPSKDPHVFLVSPTDWVSNVLCRRSMPIYTALPDHNKKRLQLISTFLVLSNQGYRDMGHGDIPLWAAVRAVFAFINFMSQRDELDWWFSEVNINMRWNVHEFRSANIIIIAWCFASRRAIGLATAHDIIGGSHQMDDLDTTPLRRIWTF